MEAIHILVDPYYSALLYLMIYVVGYDFAIAYIASQHKMWVHSPFQYCLCSFLVNIHNMYGIMENIGGRKIGKFGKMLAHLVRKFMGF